MITNKSSNLKFDHNKIVFNLTKQVINILNKIMKNINFMFVITSACNISFLIKFLLFIIFTFFRFIFLLICSSYYFQSVFINANQLLMHVVNVMKNVGGPNCLIIAKNNLQNLFK
jgi:hypothetical protein